MIVQDKRGNDIFKGGESTIAFAVNTEGCNDSGFSGIVACNYWPEIANPGKCKLGTSLSKTVDGITFYALVCYSLDNGWQDQAEVICKCFNSIETNEPIASVSIGTGLMAILDHSNFSEIQKGMELSTKNIILY